MVDWETSVNAKTADYRVRRDFETHDKNNDGFVTLRDFLNDDDSELGKPSLKNIKMYPYIVHCTLYIE